MHLNRFLGGGIPSAITLAMPRSLRYQAAGTYYHILNRGLAREDIVFNETDYQMFLRGLREIQETYSVDVFAFCLMRNHYHILLQTNLPNLSRAMRHFSHTLAQRVNRRIKRDGPVFRDRFKSIRVSQDYYLKHLVRYIHLNPVDAGIVSNPQDYPWSSARNYERHTFHSWLSGSKILKFFGKDTTTAMHYYRKFMCEGNSLEIVSFYQRERTGSILDTESLRCALDCSVKKNRLPVITSS